MLPIQENMWLCGNLAHTYSTESTEHITTDVTFNLNHKYIYPDVLFFVTW